MLNNSKLIEVEWEANSWIVFFQFCKRFIIFSCTRRRHFARWSKSIFQNFFNFSIKPLYFSIFQSIFHLENLVKSLWIHIVRFIHSICFWFYKSAVNKNFWEIFSFKQWKKKNFFFCGVTFCVTVCFCRIFSTIPRMLKTLWLTLTQYLVVLMPIAIFAVMHAARYTRKVIEVSDT